MYQSDSEGINNQNISLSRATEVVALEYHKTAFWRLHCGRAASPGFFLPFSVSMRSYINGIVPAGSLNVLRGTRAQSWEV